MRIRSRLGWWRRNFPTKVRAKGVASYKTTESSNINVRQPLKQVWTNWSLVEEDKQPLKTSLKSEICYPKMKKIEGLTKTPQRTQKNHKIKCKTCKINKNEEIVEKKPSNPCQKEEKTCTKDKTLNHV